MVFYQERLKDKIKYFYNDKKRLDDWLNAVCVSVTK